MTRLVVAVAIMVAASGIAVVARRRRSPDAPTQASNVVPTQLDRNDFTRADAPWLVVVFSSATCNTCADMVAKARALESRSVAFAEVEYTEHRDLHRRYSIDAVPTVVLADSDGVVRASFLGRVTATDLWAAVAEVREPGSRPPGGCERHTNPDQPGG
jgi:thioredoxin-like negative regulator of GroEL